MKKIKSNTLLALISTVVILLSVNCSSPKTPEVEDDSALIDSVQTITLIEEDTSQVVLVIAEDDVRDSVQNILLNQSPFQNLGCCDDESKRIQTCCCEKVIAKYGEMVKNKDPKLAEISTTDPILGDCRRKYRTAFNEIDSAKNEKKSEEEEDLDNYLDSD